MKSGSRLLAVTALALSCSATFAAQLEYGQVAGPEHTQLKFRWQDQYDIERGFVLSVSNHDIQKHLNDPRLKVKTDGIEEWLLNGVLATAQRLSTDGYVLTATRASDKILINGKGPDRIELERRTAIAQNTIEQGMKQLADQSFFTMKGGPLRVDYQEVAAESRASFRAIAQALALSTVRDTLDSYLSFLQNLPHGGLNAADGYSVMTPAMMLINNRGDSITKHLALSAMIQEQYPETKTILVQIMDQAFLGASISVGVGDKVITHEGETYVLMDANGPRARAVGELSEVEATQLVAEKADIAVHKLFD